MSPKQARKRRTLKQVWHVIPGARPSAVQAAVMANLTHPDVYMLGGYGCGKTHCCAHKGLQLLGINPGLTIGAVAQTYVAARKDLVPAFKDILGWCYWQKGEARIPFKKGRDWNYNETNHTFGIKHLGKIQIVSAEDPDRLKGETWAAAVGNEPGLWPEMSYLNLLARTRDPRARFIQRCYFGTPEGFNWLHEHSVARHPKAQFGGDPKVRVYFSDTHDAVWLPSSYVESLEDVYDDDLIEEKVRGRFVHVGSGACFAKFNRNTHVVQQAYSPNVRLVLCLDFNIAPGIAIVAQELPHPDGRQMCVHALSEITLKRGTTADVIQEFCRQYPAKDYGGELVICGDATGKAQHATGAICYDEVYRVLREHGWDYADQTPTVNPPISDRVAISNRGFEKGLVTVSPACVLLIKDLEQVVWLEGTRTIDKSNKALTHHSDAFTYELHERLSRGIVRPAARVARHPSHASRIWRPKEDAPWRRKRGPDREDED